MGTTGAPLDLTWPATGQDGWDTAYVNANFTKINIAYAALVAGGAAGPKGDPGAAGAVGVIWAGPWGSGVQYVRTDAVSFNGGSYIALADNIGVQPDTHPSTWGLLAAAGVAGPQGNLGPVGPAGPGGGTTVTFPITIAEGGTEADNPDEARQNLSAASSGQNRDINALFNLECGGTADPTTTAITIRSNGGAGTAISVGNGTDFGGMTSDAGLYAKYILCAGQINCGPIVCSGRLQVGEIGEANGGAGISVDNVTRFANGLVLLGSAPVVAAGQIGIGGQIATTASAGGGQAVPGTVLCWEIVNVGGVIGKRPIFAN